MKETLFLVGLAFCFASTSCVNAQVQSEEITCLKRVNREVSMELKKELESRFDSVKEDIRLIMKFHVKKNGLVDSIIFVRSNLLNFGINEERIKNKLNKKKYECIWNVYHSKQLKPPLA